MPAIVELRNVDKNYPLRKLTVSALQKVNLALHKGEFTVIAGPSARVFG